jgi:Rrf2 family protein
MKLSKKGEYALKALIELAINHNKGINVTLIHDIAARTKIPIKYLEQILLNLKNRGILVSKRGVGGGYSLARPPEQISLGEVIRISEGPLAPINCASVTSHVKCKQESICGLYSIMREVRDAVANIVDNISLNDVAKRTIDLIEKKQNCYNYAI